MPVTGQLDRQVEVAAVLQAGGVTGGPLAPQIVPPVNVFEFGAEHAGVQVVQTAVETVAVNVARVRSVIAQFADTGIDVRLVRHQRAAVAESAEVLLDDEA